MASRADDILSDLEHQVEEVVELRVAPKIDPFLSGELVEITKGGAVVALESNDDMSIDKHGLVHTGSIFSSAAFAAIAAINDPNGVCIGADVKFLAPIESGNVITFFAQALQHDTKKIEVKVIGKVLEIKVFEALFFIVIFDKHILRLKLSKKQKELTGD